MIEIAIAKFSDRLDHIQRIHEQMRAGGPVIDQEATLPDLNVIGMGLPSHIVAGKGKQSTAIMQTTKGGRRAAPRCLLPRCAPQFACAGYAPCRAWMCTSN
jgi:hypothetical protein